MKKTYLLCLLIISFSYTGCAQKKNSHYAAIAFYNCENFFDTIHNADKHDEDFTPYGKYHYTERIYNQKLHNIATVIGSMTDNDLPDGPAIVGLAEVENDHVLHDLVSQPEIHAKHYRYVWYNGPDERGINVALLYNPTYFHLLHSQPLHVSLQGTGSKQNTRDILYVTGTLAGDTVYLFVNHWPSRRSEEGESAYKRAAAATVCRNEINNIQQHHPTAKIVVMGDLNDNPVDSSVVNVLQSTGDANQTNNYILFNPWYNIYQSGQGTLEYKHHWDLFDQIIVSNAFIKGASGKWHYDHAAVFKKDFLIDHYKHFYGYPHRSFAGTHWINGYSDHLPVMLYLKK